MDNNRKRINSSMTYDEYLGVFEKPPKTPHFKPLDGPADIPELKLDNDTDSPSYHELSRRLDPMKEISDKIEHTYKPKNVIMEETSEEQAQTLVQVDLVEQVYQTKKRQRSQSENIQYTFLSFMQKGISRKDSLIQQDA